MSAPVRDGARRRGAARARGPRAASVVATALAAVLVLAGCVSVPTSGAVQQGDPITQDDDTGVSLTPDAPSPGADPQDIVSGFVRAQASADDDFAVAREYLATSVADSWNPRTGVSISTGDPAVDPSSDGGDALTLTFVETARVDGTGQYTAESSSTPAFRRFTLVQEKGEWRIGGEVPDGIVLTTDVFASVFASYALYFYDPTNRYLVPDVRWFPVTGGTSIVEGLLAGPSPALAQSVTSAFPAGTKLASPVTIDAGTADIDFEDAASGTGQSIDDTSLEVRQLIRAQLLASLSGYNVLSLHLTVGGVELAVPTTPSQITVDPQVDAQPVVLTADGVVSATATKTTPITGVTESAATLSGIVGGVYSIRASTLTVLAQDGVYRVDGTGVNRVDARGDLVVPSMDPDGFIWSTTADGAIRVIDTDDTATDLDQHPVPAGDRVVSLEVSRDGTRVLLYVTDADGVGSLLVVGIVRPNGRQPVLASTAITLPAVAGTPIDATWVDDQTVATLSGGSTPVVTTYLVGGPAVRVGTVDGGVAIVGGNGGVAGLRVLTAEGELFAERSTFQDTGIAATGLFSQLPG